MSSHTFLLTIPGGGCTSWSHKDPSSSQGVTTARDTQEMNTGQQERKTPGCARVFLLQYPWKQQLGRASGTSANEGTRQLLENEVSPRRACPALHLPQLQGAGGDTELTPLLELKGFPDLSSLYLTLKAISGGC